MTDLEGKPCKVRYSDPTGAKHRDRTLLQKMKSNSPSSQQQPPAQLSPPAAPLALQGTSAIEAFTIRCILGIFCGQQPTLLL